MTPLVPSPPLADSLQVVQISSVAAALAKLNIGIPVEDVIEAVRREDEAKRAAQATERRAALIKLALHPEQSPGLHMTTVIPKATKATIKLDPLAMERGRRLVELTKEAFPDGKVSDPFNPRWFASDQDVAANKRLPFILASRIVVKSATDISDNPPENVFHNVWCLWDSSAQTSFILTSQLHSAVRDNQEEGSALMDITFSNAAQTINSVIHFRPQLPNGVTFIILGQHAYGQIEILREIQSRSKADETINNMIGIAGLGLLLSLLMAEVPMNTTVDKTYTLKEDTTIP
ncbi:hypothetical protein GGX14DRAFT_667879 [Mycena pura]|uniref:Uncharacterized protein n=1 Tax=Mycena pura TaxID=153505 RepID=A0AAD6UXL7_9AGAR|nr:hypothetical protein GGX14DRAFT_667879 [Mycena pura]